MRRRLFVILPVVLLALLVLITGIIWNFQEKQESLNENLSEISRSSRDPGNLLINGRLDLIMGRLMHGESHGEAYVMEAKIQTYLVGESILGKTQTEDPDKDRFLDRLRRRLFGTAPEEQVWRDARRLKQEEAFSLELQKLYRDAGRVYKSLLDNSDDKIPQNEMDMLRIHTAFCDILTANYEDARRQSREIVETGSSSQIRKTAADMVDFIDAIIEQSSRDDAEYGSVSHGRMMYLTADYDEAIDSLSAFLDSGGGRPRQAEARYFRGRAMEEAGRISDAVAEYSRVLLLESSGPWRTESVRRLLMLEGFYTPDARQLDFIRNLLQDETDSELEPLVKEYLALIPEHIPEVPEADSIRSVTEIYVETEPIGAHIEVNGVNYGLSPVFIVDVPPGPISLKAEYEGRVVQEVASVAADRLTSIFLSLTVPVPAIEITMGLHDYSVMLDDMPLDILPGSTRVDVPPGTYILVSSGKNERGELVYIEKEITVLPGSILSVRIP